MLDEKTFHYKNIKVTYYEAGNGPPLLFIHGIGIRALTYKKTLLELSKNFHIYTPDLPGFGKSDLPNSNWTFHDYAEYLSAFLDYLNVTDIVLVGHSFGGRIALELSASSQKVIKLILVDTTPFANYYINSKKHLAKLILNTTLEIFLERNPSYAKIGLDVLSNLKRHKFAYRKFKKSIDLALKSQDFVSSKITIPTLILWGEKDRVIKPQMAYELKKEILNSEVKIIPSANHAWCFTKPKLLSEEVLGFVNNV